MRATSFSYVASARIAMWSDLETDYAGTTTARGGDVQFPIWGTYAGSDVEFASAIGEGRLSPEIIISHRMSLADAAKGYQVFNDREDECRKVVLTP